ncbi:hypothetical protein [Streptomyces sp. I05A-00742]|uniref:hypothetical protein n=1 Tax=Streptomyces sp. I05A-00742 TaxID=2732853 RepID=UPI001487BB89|nr:hypothetical protein [Streptomyces sp. I05A-00742]
MKDTDDKKHPRTAADEAIEEIEDVIARPDERHERDAADAMTPNTGAQDSVQHGRRRRKHEGPARRGH